MVNDAVDKGRDARPRWIDYRLSQLMCVIISGQMVLMGSVGLRYAMHQARKVEMTTDTAERAAADWSYPSSVLPPNSLPTWRLVDLVEKDGLKSKETEVILGKVDYLTGHYDGWQGGMKLILEDAAALLIQDDDPFSDGQSDGRQVEYKQGFLDGYRSFRQTFLNWLSVNGPSDGAAKNNAMKFFRPRTKSSE